MNTYETIAKLLAEQKDMDANDIRPDMTFSDLELDSLDVAELVMNLEDELGVPVEDRRIPQDHSGPRRESGRGKE